MIYIFYAIKDIQTGRRLNMLIISLSLLTSYAARESLMSIVTFTGFGLFADRNGNHDVIRTAGKLTKIFPLSIATGVLGLQYFHSAMLGMASPYIVMGTNMLLRKAGIVDRRKSKKFDTFLSDVGFITALGLTFIGISARMDAFPSYDSYRNPSKRNSTNTVVLVLS